ncbi:MAG: porin [Burkholderiaceae bacterium]
MTRSLTRCAVAALALLAAGTCAAQSSVSLYGLVDMTGGRFQDAGGLKTWRLDANGLSQSFLGLRVVEDVGGGLKVRAQLEHYLRPDTGAVGRFGADPFWSRSANVGFQGAFGTSVIGRTATPLYQSTALLNPFGDSFTFSPTLRQYFSGNGAGSSLGETVLGDIVWNNSLAFSSPDFNGLSYNLIANLGEGGVGATGRNMGANVVYFRGPLAATVAWQQVRNGVLAPPPGFQHQTTLHLGLAYDFGPAKLFGQFGRIRTDASAQVETRLWQLGTVIPVGETGLVRVAYGSREVDSGGLTLTNRTFAIGYDHYLSKNTDLYGAVVLDRLTGLASGRSVASGLRVRF